MEIDNFKSSEEAKAYGWKLFHNGDVARSEPWFRKSNEWEADKSAVIGLILAAFRLHHQDDYKSLLQQNRGKFGGVAVLDVKFGPQHVGRPFVPLARHVAQVHTIKNPRHSKPSRRVDPGDQWDKSASDIVAAAQSGKYDQAYAMLEQRRGARLEPRGLSVVRGWVLFHRGQWEEAKHVFANLDHGEYSPERREGLRVIDLGYTPPHSR